MDAANGFRLSADRDDEMMSAHAEVEEMLNLLSFRV